MMSGAIRRMLSRKLSMAFEKWQAEAAHLAKEIESKVSTNMHIAEERNQRRAARLAPAPCTRTRRRPATPGLLPAGSRWLLLLSDRLLC